MQAARWLLQCDCCTRSHESHLHTIKLPAERDCHCPRINMSYKARRQVRPSLQCKQVMPDDTLPQQEGARIGDHALRLRLAESEIETLPRGCSRTLIYAVTGCLRAYTCTVHAWQRNLQDHADINLAPFLTQVVLLSVQCFHQDGSLTSHRTLHHASHTS